MKIVTTEIARIQETEHATLGRSHQGAGGAAVLQTL